jgi:hypothetical protein
MGSNDGVDLIRFLFADSHFSTPGILTWVNPFPVRTIVQEPFNPSSDKTNKAVYRFSE